MHICPGTNAIWHVKDPRVIALGRRDCSLQRRHQKVIEESPAFDVANHVRREMANAAVRLASLVEYRNVGSGHCRVHIMSTRMDSSSSRRTLTCGRTRLPWLTISSRQVLCSTK